MKRILLVVAFTVLSLCFAGLSPAQNVPGSWAVPDLAARLKGIRTVQVVIPEVKVYEVTAGGVPEWKDDWSNAARKNILEAASGNLQSRGIARNQGDLPVEGDLAEALALFRAVAVSIRAYASGPNSFPARSALDYSVGTVKEILDKSSADAFLVITASDYVSSSGRQAVMATGVVVGALIGIVPVPRTGVASVETALIDRDGKILFYRMKRDGSSDLRDFNSSRKFVDDIFNLLPRAR